MLGKTSNFPGPSYVETDRPAFLKMSVPQLVQACASAAPHSIALVAAGQSISYRRLCGWANNIAQQLRSCGVGRESIVAVCMERSADSVCAELGVLTAGAAYLPLDPSYPDERLMFMLDDAQPVVLLTSPVLAGRLPIRGKYQTIALEGGPESVVREPCGLEVDATSGENLAYVIYTSGSTGQPKGVQIKHSCLLNLVHWHQQTFEVTSRDRATQMASLSFDAAVWELWPYLTAGASVYVVDDEVRSESITLRNWLIHEQITIAFAPTPIAERLIGFDWPQDTKLRTLLTGGDVLHRYPPRHLPFQLINNYGPTECTVVASSGSVPANEHPKSLPTIGRAISNTQIYLLNDEMRPVPTGEVGEIYIGGAGVARGYLNRPELNQEQFVLDPFNTEGEARLYKSGDLARALPNGEIEFVGRADEQIKVRGFRIEPGEIVAALNEYPDILQSTVVARAQSSGDKVLVAYIVSGANTANAEDLRTFLRRRLPEYMVPSMFVKLETLPLSPNGKVDRGKLPEPTVANRIGERNEVTAQTLIEQELVVMLSNLLELNSVSVDENVFLLGGHSLLAAQLIRSIRDRFDVEVPLMTVFNSPTAAGLAQLIEKSILTKMNLY